MYGIFTYIWVIFGANVGKYSIHGASGDVYSVLSHIIFHTQHTTLLHTIFHAQLCHTQPCEHGSKNGGISDWIITLYSTPLAPPNDPKSGGAGLGLEVEGGGARVRGIKRAGKKDTPRW